MAYTANKQIGSTLTSLGFDPSRLASLYSASGVGASGVGASGVGASGVGASGVGASGVGASGVGADGFSSIWNLLPSLGRNTQSILNQGGRLLGSQAALTPGYGDVALGADEQYLLGDASHPGMLSLYTNSLLPQISDATNAVNANALAKYGPQYSQAIRATSPDSTALYDKLAQQAGEGLDAGTLMTPAQMSQLNNSIRSAQGARGMSYGPAASYQEVMANSDFGQNLLQSRQKFAGDISRMGYDQYTAPVLQSMGGAAGSAGSFLDRSGNFTNRAMGYGDTFARLGNYGQDFYDTAINAAMGRQIASSNNNASTTGATIGAVGSGVAGLAGLAAALI
jgi:hypothetical protein